MYTRLVIEVSIERKLLPGASFKKVTELSQMPCRISTDAHEWINEVPTVPACGPVNPPPGEQSRDTQREEKTLWTEE